MKISSNKFFKFTAQEAATLILRGLKQAGIISESATLADMDLDMSIDKNGYPELDGFMIFAAEETEILD
jgi:hypothetical protein